MTREEHIAELVKNGMLVDLAPRAVDAIENLIMASPFLLEKVSTDLEAAGWLGYGFMQGFVAGSMASVHHN